MNAQYAFMQYGRRRDYLQSVCCLEGRDPNKEFRQRQEDL